MKMSFVSQSQEVHCLILLIFACYNSCAGNLDSWWGTKDIAVLEQPLGWAQWCDSLSTVWECQQAPWCPLRSTPTPVSSSSHHTTTGLVARGEKAAPAFHSLCHNSHYCTQAFSQDIQHPGKWGILLRIPLSTLREQKQGWKSLLGAFQRGWSPDTAALCTSQTGQRPLSWRFHISALTGLLCSCQPELHNAQSAHGRPLPSHFPTERSERTPLTNHSAAAEGSSSL